MNSTMRSASARCTSRVRRRAVRARVGASPGSSSRTRDKAPIRSAPTRTGTTDARHVAGTARSKSQSHLDTVSAKRVASESSIELGSSSSASRRRGAAARPARDAARDPRDDQDGARRGETVQAAHQTPRLLWLEMRERPLDDEHARRPRVEARVFQNRRQAVLKRARRHGTATSPTRRVPVLMSSFATSNPTSLTSRTEGVARCANGVSALPAPAEVLAGRRAAAPRGRPSSSRPPQRRGEVALQEKHLLATAEPRDVGQREAVRARAEPRVYDHHLPHTVARGGALAKDHVVDRAVPHRRRGHDRRGGFLVRDNVDHHLGEAPRVSDASSMDPATLATARSPARNTPSGSYSTFPPPSARCAACSRTPARDDASSACSRALPDRPELLVSFTPETDAGARRAPSSDIVIRGARTPPRAKLGSGLVAERLHAARSCSGEARRPDRHVRECRIKPLRDDLANLIRTLLVPLTSVRKRSFFEPRSARARAPLRATPPRLASDDVDRVL